jgi:DHA1 family inner membrane transport protein
VLGASIALFLFGVAGWAIVPAQQSRLLALAADQGAGVIALLGSTVYVGSAAGAAVGGLILAQAGPAALPVIAGAGVVLGLLVYALSLGISRG